MIKIIRSVFNGGGHEGDFGWMIKQFQHKRTLFLFNDNEREFYDHFNGGPHHCSTGGGNAVIRPYQCLPEPMAVGIPTGTYQTGPHYKGYSVVDDHVRKVITDAMSQIESLLSSGRFDSIAFSWSDKTKLGGYVFETAQPVRDYIVDQIYLTAGKF